MIQDVTRLFNEGLENASDEEVLRASRANPEAFRILVRRYEAPFLRKAKSILRDPQDAEEIVQDAFTRIYVYADRYQPTPGASFSSWGYTILTRLAYTRYTKLSQGRKRIVELDTEVYERIPDQADFVEELSIRNEVIVALAKLPETMAHVLRLQFIEGKSQEEIAELEGSSVSAVKTRVHRAKKLFKQAYDEQRYE
jgi:RNA polymerase sigma-70 factor (ECF subfamily)